MDRVIKFRGKGADWKYGDYHNFHGIPSITQKEGTKLIIYAVKSETVGQFTGRKDCKGKEIFEGDLLKVKDPDGREFVHQVAFDNCFFGIISHWSPGEIIPLWIPLGFSECKVIGNVFDNPELLEGGSDDD